MSHLLTLGHGTATVVELAALIRNAGIELIVDVRTVPKSRRHPQFWREQMEVWVPTLSGSAYTWQPRLGGFRKANPASNNVALRHPSFRAYADYMETDDFASALDGLLAQAAEKRVAILCSETVWWRCHRRLISDAAVLLHSVDVQHLMHDGKLRPHLSTAGSRITVDGKLRYDVLFTEEASTA
ncbi:MAG: DNA repair protein [Candidatus Meridianibacter frigidus]|nr:MAG: DNA repair protein [Candidatus Eremiobacteraeota bacterium]